MREIGSEFWNIPIAKNKTNLIFSSCQWFLSGRSAFRSIIQDIKIKLNKNIRVAIPDYLCESLIEPLIIEKCDFEFYNISIQQDMVICDTSSISSVDAILKLEYFGYNLNYIYTKNLDCLIIRDLTHFIFSNQKKDADYYFGSLRKWAGFVSGGFAFTNDSNYKLPFVDVDVNEFFELRTQAMEKKNKYIKHLLNEKCYLDDFQKVEEILENCDIGNCFDKDIDNALHLDIRKIVNKRRINASILINKLNSICLIKNINKNDCPLCVPIIVENRDELRIYLKNNNIYLPIHWPKSNLVSSNSILYDKELSLVCDQRYNIFDMYKIVRFIKKFLKR